MGYFDDFGLIAPHPLFEDAPPYFSGLNVAFGFAPELSKSEWGELLDFVGFIVDFPPFPRGPSRQFLPVTKR